MKSETMKKNKTMDREKTDAAIGPRIILLSAVAVVLMMAFAGNAAGLGIAPGKLNVEYKPGDVIEQNLIIINNEAKESKVMLYVDAEYSDIVQFEQKVVEMSPSDSNKEVKMTITLPGEGLDFGPNEIHVIATEFPSDKEELGSNVASLQAVVSRLIIDVPYPGSFLEADFQAVVDQKEDPITFVIKATNRGEEELKEVSAVIDIYGPTNEVIATVTTDKKSIGIGKMRELVSTYYHDLNIGKYYAKASINFDGNLLSRELVFEVGEKSITIVDITADEFELGDIARFQIWIKNNWVDIIDEVYGDVVIKDEYGKTLTQYTTASVAIEGMATKHLDAYWDTAGQSEGTYPARLVVHFEGQNIEESFNIELSKDEIKTDFKAPLTAKAIDEEAAKEGLFDKDTLIIFLVVFSIIANTALILFFMRRKKKKNN